MSTKFYSAAAWINADPRRAKTLSVLALLTLFAASHLIPGAHAIAGPAGGGTDIGGI